MKRRAFFTSAATLAAALVLVGGASAQAPPCNDTDGDGSPSGREYAQFHVTALAHEGMLGNGGHKPGSHRGFSACK